MELWTILLTIILSALAYYYYSKDNYFVKRGINYVTPYPFVGNMGPALLRRTPLIECLQNAYNVNKNAKYFGFFDFSNPVIVIRDWELCKNITIKYFDHFVNRRGFGEPTGEPLFDNNLLALRDNKWREIRNLLSPAFTSSKMRGMFVLMSDCAKDFGHYFAEKSMNKPFEVDAKDAFARYTTDVIGTCAFGVKIDSMRDPNNEFYVIGRRAMNFDVITTLKLVLARISPRISKLFNIKLFNPEVEKFFNELVRNTIATRDKEGIVRPDMLQLMMETRNNGDCTLLTIQEMTAQAFIFFFGGFETSSATMCFIAHEIADNEEFQEKLRKEVDEVFDECHGDPTYEAVNNMVYLDAVVNETLRLFPVLGFLDRVCNTEFELPPAEPGKKAVLLKPGDTVWIPAYPLQRDPKFFENPNVFDPERFIENGKISIDPAAPLLAFGQGPRMCIGNRFALLEIKILLVHLLRKCSIKPGKRMITPLQLSAANFGMTAEGGFWLEFQPRQIE